MAELNKKLFKGIRQVSLATFNSLSEKEGYLWLVKDGNKRIIYFGNQEYAYLDPDSSSETIQKKIDEAFEHFVAQDLLHSFDADGNLKNEIAFKLDEDEKHNPILHLTGKDGADVATIDMSKFAIDGMIESVTYDKEKHTLTITWNTAAGKKPTTIDLTDLIDIYTAGNGIEVTDKGVISIKIAEGNQDFLVLDGNGIKITNVDGSHIELGTVLTNDKGEEVPATEKVTNVLQTIYDTIKEVEDNAISVEGDGKSINVFSDNGIPTKKIVSLKSEETSNSTVNEGHIEVVANSENGVYAQMYYMTNVESTTGNVTTGAITGESVSLYNATVKDNVRIDIKVTEDVEIEDVTLSGDFPKTDGGNAIVKINGGNAVTLNNVTYDETVTGYNALEIGLNATTAPKYVDIQNCNFNGKLANNAILIFGTANDAVINIKNCHFGTLSNCLRLSNKFNAKNVVVNITDCSVEQWDSKKEWEGFLICEDYTSDTESLAKLNNLFGDGKITVNFTNLTYQGQKITGESDKQQITYVYFDNGGLQTDAKYLPIVNFK